MSNEWVTGDEAIKLIGQCMVDNPANGFERLNLKASESSKTTWTPDSWGWLFEDLELDKPFLVRIKPKTITRTIEVPEPYRGKMTWGQSYFMPNAINPNNPVEIEWCKHRLNLDRMAAGRVYPDRADAIAAGWAYHWPEDWG